MFLLLWRALNLHRRVCAFNRKIQQLKGFMYLFMYVRNSETLLVLHFRMWFTGFLGDTWESVLPQGHPPPNPPRLSLSLSLYGLHYSCILQLTHLLQRGGRTFYNMWRFILSQIYLNAAETLFKHMQDSQQRFRTWDSNIEIFRDEADFKALLIIEHSCTHLLTLLLPYMDVPDSRVGLLCCQVRHCAATRDRV